MTKAIVAKVWALGIDETLLRRSRPPIDATPPTVPTLISAVAQSSSALQLTCGVSADAQSGVREYLFEYRPSGTGSYVEHGRTQHTGETITYALDGLAASTAYDVRAKAVDASANANVSGASNVLTAVTAAGSSPTGFAPNWPRLGAVIQSGTQNYELLANREHWSKFNLLSFVHYHKWQSGRSMTMQQVMADMKSRSPWAANEMAYFIYVKYDSMSDSLGTNAAERAIMDKLNLENWWTYQLGTSGTKLSHSYQRSNGVSTYKVTAHNQFCPRVGGKNYQEWLIDLMIAQNVTGNTGNSPNDQVDGFMCDNQMAKPLWAGDMDRNGLAEPESDPTKALWTRQAIKAYYDYVRAEWPEARYQIGNITSWGHPTAVIDVNNQVPDGGVMEGMMGKSYAPHTWGSFKQLGEYARKMQDACRNPKLMIFMDADNTSTGYARMRYGMGACYVLSDAYYMPGGTSYAPDHRFWLDEFDLNGVGVGWLGQPVEPRQTVPRYEAEAASINGGAGIYRRDFFNSVTGKYYAVLVWTRRGRGQVSASSTTVYTGGQTLGGTWKRLSLPQQAAWNSGATGITTVPANVAPQNCMILERTAA